MKLGNIAAAFFITTLLFPSLVFPQWLEEIQTESDWEDWYNEGYYDYNSYQLYRELGEGIYIADTAEFLSSAMGNSLSEITREWPDKASSAGDSIRPVFRAHFREGQRLKDGGNDGYTLISSTRGHISFEYKGRNERDSWNTERRSITFGGDDYKVTVGNFIPNVGTGLGIGRFDYRPISFNSTSNGGDNFLYPINSYYNGAAVNYRNIVDLIYSNKKYGDVKKDLAAGAVSYSIDNVHFGFAAGATRLSSNKFNRKMGIGSLFLSQDRLGMKSEIGYAESGIGFCMRLRRAGSEIRLWHYDKSFLNLQSSGFAHSDYVSYGDTNLGYSFRQPQAGESGAYWSYRKGWKKFSGTVSSEIWKRSPVYPIAMDNAIWARYLPGNHFEFYSSYRERFGSVSRRTLLESGINFHRQFMIGLLGSIWIEHGDISKSKSLYHLYCSVPIRSRLSFAGRFRWKLNGDFDYFVEERTMISENLSLKVTYRWRDAYQNQIGPVYLLMESSL